MSRLDQALSEDDIEAFHNQRDRIAFSDTESGSDNGVSFDEYGVLDLPSAEDDDDDDDDEYDETETTNWGKSRKTFYSGDIAEGDLEDEASEARKLQEKTRSTLSALDYGIPSQIAPSSLKNNQNSSKKSVISFDIEYNSEGEGIDEEFGVDLKRNSGGDSKGKLEKKKEDSRKFEKDNVTQTSTFDEDSFGTEADLVGMDSVGLSKILPPGLKAENRETKVALKEFKRRLVEVKQEIEPIVKKIRLFITNDSGKGLEFLQSKYQLLIGYCANLALYILLQTKGAYTKDHPVVTRLVKYRLLLEKIRPMEAKMQHTIDRLVSSASSKSNQVEVEALAHRPNVDLLQEFSDEEEKSSAPDNEQIIGAKASEKYKAPKVAPVRFEGINGAIGDDSSLSKRERRERERAEIIASRSRLMADVQADLEDRPLEEAIDPVYGSNVINPKSSEMKKTKRYEEENFVRVSLSKAERRRLDLEIQKPVDELADLNDFFRERKTSKRSTSTAGSVEKLLGTKRKTSEISENRGSSKMAKFDDIDEEMSDIEDDLEEYKQASKKAADRKNSKNNMKLSKHDVRFTPGKPLKDMDNQHETRPASYDMLKNKGLMPNRTKEEENPRVNRRKKWERAQKKISSFKPVYRDGKSTGAYGGEATGIRTNLSRSVRF